MDSQRHIWDYAIPHEIARASIRQNWMAAWEGSTFRLALLLSVVVSGAIASFLPYYFGYIEARPGVHIYDPVLALIKPVDVSVITFSLLYLCVVMCLGYISYFPKFFLKAVWAYCILTCLRMLVMLFVPLEAPKELIFLVDPILSLIVYQDVNVTKDLFFSGHTATMFLLVFGMPNKYMKGLFVLGGFIMAGLLLVQHVHYTVDVMVAPFFSYVSWKLAERIEKQVFGEVSSITSEG